MLALAYSLFWANFLYGIAAKFELLPTRKFKILHHLIYFLAMLTLFSAMVYEFYSQSALSGMALLFVFALLLGMTRFSGRNPRHWQYAMVCNVVYTIIFFYLS